MTDRISIATDWLTTEGITAFRLVFSHVVVLDGRAFISHEVMSDAEVLANAPLWLEDVRKHVPDLRCTVVIARAVPGDFLAFKIADGHVECVGATTDQERRFCNGGPWEDETVRQALEGQL